MNLSEYSIEFLGNFVAGDIEGFPYRSGPQLVKFFNQFGVRDVYPSGGGFPTRRIYAQDKIREFNGSATLKEIIAKTLDPREFTNSVKTATGNYERPLIGRSRNDGDRKGTRRGRSPI